MNGRQTTHAPEVPRRVHELFDAAVELDAEARAAYLAGACAGDAVLRREVESLLAAFDRTPASRVFPPLLGDVDASAPAVGARVGPYVLVRAIGEGGMGVVYEARRDDVGKTVALKLVRHGRLASSEHLRRFHLERRVLARLEHEHIARLLDAGATDSGLPYLVMEYVPGESIDRYCDARRLDVEARLALFAQVCDAVHYAHRHAVVHRDLKPSNIVVTADGRVKLLDFGIAALVEEREDAETITGTGRMVLTPDYASPEQVRGAPVTVASDVHALGLLLYELLTGRRAFHRGARATPELLRAVCEEEPELPSRVVARAEPARRGDATAAALAPDAIAAARGTQPSRLARRLAGDLDVIVLRALRKEPLERYASAEALREDVTRHLAGRPVLARGRSFWYRARRGVRRHRAAVTAALVVLSLGTGLAEVTARARDRAAARRIADVRSLARELVLGTDLVGDLPGALPARAALSRRAIEQLEQLGREAGDDPALRRELADAYVKLGLVQGMPTAANLGDVAGARASFGRALALARPLVAADPNDLAARRALALAHETMSDAEAWSGRLPQGLEHARRALAEWERLAASAPTRVAPRRAVAMSRIKLGDLLGNPHLPNLGDGAGAAAQYRTALALMHGVPRDSLDDWATRRLLALVHERLGTMLHGEGRHAEAVAELEQALAAREALVRERATSVDARRDLAVAHQLLCEAQLAGGDGGGALERCRRSVALYETLHAADAGNAQGMRDLVLGGQSLQKVLAARGDAPGALAEVERGIALSRRLLASRPAHVAARRDLARGLLLATTLHAALASRPGVSAASRRGHRDAAAASFAEGGRLLAALVGGGAPPAEDAALLDRARVAVTVATR